MTVKDRMKKKEKTKKQFVKGSSPKRGLKKKKNDSNAGDNTEKPSRLKPKLKDAHAEVSSPAKKRKASDPDGGKSPKKRKHKDGKEPRPSKIQHQDGAPDWKQVRADAADIKNRRKAQNKMFEVGKHMKKLWEELPVEKCSADRRRQLVSELSGLVRGRVPQLVRAHDRARVCESLFQYGGPETRVALFEEVRHQLAELSRDKYARHFVLKMLAHGTKEQKDAIGAAFTGRVTALMGHKFGSEVGESYFRDCASADAQQRMLMEFYGTEFLLRTAETRSLEELCQQQPEKRTIYLTNVRSQLQSLLDKQLLTGSLSHRLLREYLSLCPVSDRADVIESLREAVVQMLHTKDGARVGLMCLWWGTTKDRKAIVKSLKTFVAKVCCDEHGYAVMLALLDVVDDTRLVKKALLEEMMTNVADIVPREHGRKVLHYLLSPRDTTYFHPQLVATLAEGDANTTSKKEPAVRRRELLEAVSEPLLKTASIHCLEWMADSSLCVLLTHILCRCTGDSLSLPLTQLARRVAEPVTSVTDSHLVNNSAAYIQLKKLIQADRQRAADGSSVLFSTLILKELSRSEEAILSWIGVNRAAFLLVIMLETEVPAVVEQAVQLLQPLVRRLKPACRGAEILKKKVAAAAREPRPADAGD